MESTANHTSSGAAADVPYAVSELAFYLDIQDVISLHLLVLDDEVYAAFSGLLRKSLDEHDLTSASGWRLARRYFLVGSSNDNLVDYDRNAGHPAGEYMNAMAIATHFEMVEERRMALGIESWGSQSQSWRVCYQLFDYFINQEDFVFDGDWEKLEDIRRAVEWYTLDMCAPGVYLVNDAATGTNGTS